MQKVVTAEEMREIDRLTTEKYGIPSLILMENAANAAARVILEKFNGSVKGKSVLVLCGKGNNGGDGAALARILWTLGAEVYVLLLGKVEHTKGEAKINFDILLQYHYQENPIYLKEIQDNKELSKWWKEVREKDWWFFTGRFKRFDIIIDALFGTGLNRPLDSLSNSFLDLARDYTIDKFPSYVISIDLPSGMCADSIKTIGFNLDPDLTITFTAPKLANVFPPQCYENGELRIVSIGSPVDLIKQTKSKLYISETQDVIDWLYQTKLKPNSYKKTRGTALIIAGSENYSGAAVLAANACFASGCGMVSVAVPTQILPIVATKTSDEIIVKTIDNIEFNVDVVGIGCGLSNDETTHKFIRETVENRKIPMVLDAEALNALSPFSLQGSDEFPLILTPHIGEFKRLLGREIGEDKIIEAREFAIKHHVILVLKGERSIIAKPDGTVVINPTGNAGISRAGAGDTLTGIITGFLAQALAVKQLFLEDLDTNLDIAFNTVISALYIGGLAGEIAAEKFSERLMTATDVRNCLQEAIEKVNNEK
jgi:ADP-dependent NAD(P)H-hydrate dehydratase / NAD(P)H-hydrate epimerase